LLEGPEFFDVTVGALTTSDPSVAASIPALTDSSTVTIDDDEMATLQFADSDSAVHEQNDPATNSFDVSLLISGSHGMGGSLAVPVSVVVDNTGGTATDAADYGDTVPVDPVGPPPNASTPFDPVTVTFGAGTFSTDTMSVDMHVVNDAMPEGTETAIFGLSGATGPATTIGTTFAVHTVTIHDREVKIVANDSAPFENQVNNAQFTVTIDTISADDTDVVFRIHPDSTATLGVDPDDFVFGPQVTTVPAGTMDPAGVIRAFDVYYVTILGGAIGGGAEVIDIDLQDDSLFDPFEVIELELLSATNAGSDLVEVGAMDSDFMTITDDEGASTVTVTNTSSSPPAEGTAPLTAVDGEFTLNLDVGVDADATVTLTIGGDAILGTDYIFTDGTGTITGTGVGTIDVLIPSGVTSVTINVEPIEDGAMPLVELDETVSLTPLSVSLAAPPTPTGAVISGAGASLTILDDETATVAIASSTDGAEPGIVDGSVTFTQSLPASTDTFIDVSLTGTATGEVDYGPVPETGVPNDTLVTAQDLDAEIWTKTSNPIIGDSTIASHVTVLGTGDGTVDLYSFTARAGETITFDIDGATFDSEVFLLDSGGFIVGSNDDNAGDPGSTGSTDSRASFVAPADGIYYVGVTDFFGTFGAISPGESYTLHVSVDNHGVMIPAGATSVTFPTRIADDLILENDETIVITANSVTGTDGDITVSPIFGADNTTVTIFDNEQMTVSIASGLNALEADIPVNGTFTIAGDIEADKAIKVPFEVVEPGTIGPGDSQYGVDYLFSSNVLGSGTLSDPFYVLLPADTVAPSVTVEIIPINELIVEQNETVTLRLLEGPTGSASSLEYDATGDGDSDVIRGTDTASILLQDVDLAVVVVNSNIDIAVEGGANGEWEIILAERDDTIPLIPTPVIPINPVTSSVDTIVTYEITFTDVSQPTGGNPASAADLDGATVYSGSITIPAGTDRVFLPISAILDSPDPLNEGVEEVFLRVLTVTSGDSDIDTADPSTNDDDDVVFIQDVDDTTVKIEGITDGEEAGLVSGVFEVSLVGGTLVPSTPITVNYTVTGTATTGLDHTLTSGSVVIDPTSAGLTSALITVPVLQDSLVEGPESVTITIDSISYTGPQSISVDAMKTDSIDIIDDDAGVVWINATDQFAGEGSNDGQFTVELSNPSATGVLVPYTIIFPSPVFGTPHATEGFDFQSLSGSVLVPANLTTATIDIDVIDDAVLAGLGEGYERVVIQLDAIANPLFSVTSTVGPTDGIAGGGTVDGDRDYVVFLPDQTLSVTDFSDGMEGTSPGVFEVSIDVDTETGFARPSTTSTFVTYTLSVPVGGGADEGFDYATTTGVVEIPAGSLSAFVFIDPVTVGDDTVLENPEDVIITLTGVSNVSPDAGADITVSSVLGANTATLTIFDDDYGYVTIEGTKGTEGGTDGSFTVTLRDADGNPTTATEDIDVSYSLSGLAANGVDFALISSTVTILDGDTSATILIDVTDDNFLEGDESLTLTMTGVSSALATLPTAPTVERVFLGALGGPTITFQQGIDGYFGAVDTFVRESAASVNYSGTGTVQLDDAGAAEEHGLLRFQDVFGTGFGQIPLGSMIVSADLLLYGTGTGGSFAIHDLVDDLDFSTIKWENALSNGIAGIQADDIEAAMFASGGGLMAGGGTTDTYDVQASLAAWSAGASNFGWALFASLGTTPEFRSSDFGADGNTTRPALTVTVDTSATIVICDNETASLDITGTTDAAEPTTDGVVTVTLSGADLPTDHDIVIPYTIGPAGTALQGSDYGIPFSGTITIAGGTSSNTFLVNVLDDLVIEGLENVEVSIGTPTIVGPNAASIAPLVSIGLGTDLVDIIDNDAAELEVEFLGSGGSELPFGSGHSDSIFRISLVGTTSAGVTSATNTNVTFSLSGSTTAGVDYVTPTTFTVTIPAGATSVDVGIDIIDDLLNEFPETLIVTIDSFTGSSGITISGTAASDTDLIEDDDALVVDITATDPIASENPNSDTAVFTITQNKESVATTQIPFAITGLDADPPTGLVAGNPVGSDDYTIVSDGEITWLSPTIGYATFPAGTTSTNITIIATQDFDPMEGSEFIDIEILPTVTVGTTTITLNNPTSPSVSLPPVSGAGVPVIESEPNDLLASAQSLELETWSLNFNDDINANDGVFTNISTTTPHVSITGTGDGTFDYYSFTVGAGETITFDIDDSNGFDSELFLYDAFGTLLAENDDTSPFPSLDPGSTSIRDSLGSFTVPVAGTYIVGVGKWDSVGDPGGIVGTAPDVGDFYTLNVAVSGHVTGPAPIAAATVEIVDETFEVSVAKTDSPATEDNFNGQFTVSISNPTQVGNDVTVPFTVVNGQVGDIALATYNVDYTLGGAAVTILSVTPTTITGEVVITGGDTQALISVIVLPDAFVEGVYAGPVPGAGVENVELTIGTPVSDYGQAPLDAINIASLGSAITATEGIIDNDETNVSVAVVDDLGGGDPAGISEDSNNGAFEFSIDKFAEDRDIKVEFEITGPNTADLGVDYIFSSNVFGTGTTLDPYYVIISEGTLTERAIIDVSFDTLVEGDETVSVEIISVSEFEAEALPPFLVVPAPTDDIGMGSPFAATATIEDNDAAVVTVVAVDADAGEETANPGIFELTLSTMVNVPVTVTYVISGDASSDADGNPNDDYQALSGSVTFPANTLTQQVLVSVLDDIITEDDETVIMTLDMATNVALVTGSQTATGMDTVIISSDEVSTATLTTTAEPSEDGDIGVYTVTLDFAADENITIPLVDITPLPPGFATNPGDFSLSGSVTILAGEFSGVVNVTAVDDGIAEGDEDLTHVLGTPSAPFGAPGTAALVISDAGSATQTITDNDVPTFNVDEVEVVEGTGGGPTIMTFTVSLSDPIAIPYSVMPTLGSSSGTAGALDMDFPGSTAPTLTFPAGSTAPITFTVEVFHDIVHEADETFTVGLTTLTAGPTVSTAAGKGTILNDDFVTYTISSPFDYEGTNASPYIEGSSYTTLTFVITPSIPVDIDIPVSVDYLDIGGGTPAATGADFGAIFAPFGTQSLPFGTDYDNGTDIVGLGNPVEGFPAFSTASLSVTVDVVQDLLTEGDASTFSGWGFETFQTAMSSTDTLRETSLGGKIFVDAFAFIDDNEGTTLPHSTGTTLTPAEVSVTALTVDQSTASEPGGSFGDGEFTFAVSTPVDQPIIISYTYTIDGLPGDPNGDIDPSTPLSGTITIPASVDGAPPITSVTLPLKALDDMNVEDDEDVVLTITGVSSDPNVTFSTTPATIEIQDDDSATLSISSASDSIATEGDPGDTATFVVSLSQLSDTSTTVDLIVQGTSTASTVDYSGLPLQVIIPANTLSVPVTITGLQDSMIEGTENLDVKIEYNLLGDANISVGPMDEASIDIVDDGDGLTLNAEFGQDGAEPGTDSTDEGAFILQLRDAFGDPAILPAGSTTLNAGLTITYTVTGFGPNPATPGVDFSAVTGTVNLPEGSSFATVSIDVTDDLFIEGDESLKLTIVLIEDASGPITSLPGPVGPSAGEPIAIGDSMETIKIVDNDLFAVESVKVAGSGNYTTPWSSSYLSLVDSAGQGYAIPDGSTGGQDDVLPWVNVDTIYVTFNSEIDAATLIPANFSLVEVDGSNGTPTVLSVTAAGPNVAKLTLSENLGTDRYELVVSDALKNTAGANLDGNYDDNVDALPSGDGTVGGDFNFSFNVLHGDFDNTADPNSAIVLLSDLSLVSSNFATPTTTSTMFVDGNGDGIILLDDLSIVSGNFTNTLPALPRDGGSGGDRLGGGLGNGPGLPGNDGGGKGGNGGQGRSGSGNDSGNGNGRSGIGSETLGSAQDLIVPSVNSDSDRNEGSDKIEQTQLESQPVELQPLTQRQQPQTELATARQTNENSNVDRVSKSQAKAENTALLDNIPADKIDEIFGF